LILQQYQEKICNNIFGSNRTHIANATGNKIKVIIETSNDILQSLSKEGGNFDHKQISFRSIEPGNYDCFERDNAYDYLTIIGENDKCFGLY
jgi:hypothetical protein